MKIFYTIFQRGTQLGFDWLKLCLRSLRKHSDCKIIVVLVDNLEKNDKSAITSLPVDAEIIKISADEWNNRRLLCKLEQLNLIVQKQPIRLPGKTKIIMGDTDIFFMDDPFKAFSNFDIGLTTRIYKFYTPINEGMVFYKVNDRVKQFIPWMIDQIKNPTWWPYLEVRSERDNLDWNCGQDFIHAIYRNDALMKQMFSLEIEDVGPQWNYFAGCGVLGNDDAVFLMKHAIENKVAPVLHFKGDRLKKMITEIDFERYLK